MSFLSLRRFFLCCLFVMLFNVGVVDAQTQSSHLVFLPYIIVPSYIEEHSVSLDTTLVNIPAPLTDAIINNLKTRPTDMFSGTKFILTSARLEANWALLSIAALDGDGAVSGYLGSGNSASVILATSFDSESWQASLKNTKEFFILLNQAPDDFISPSVKKTWGEVTNPASAAKTNTVSYKWPWPAGVTWQWTQGWHNPFSSYAGLDIGTTTTNDFRVIASAGGTVDWMCYGANGNGAIVKIKDDDQAILWYAHLDTHLLDPAIKVGVRVEQGQLLGPVKPDTWDEPNQNGCEQSTNQLPNWAHLHWILPTDRSFTIEGWTISYPNNTFVNGSQTKTCPGVCLGAPPPFTSSNQVTTPSTPEPGIIVQENDGNAEQSGTATDRHDSPAGSVVSNGHAFWTYAYNGPGDIAMKWKPPLDKCGEWEAQAYIAWINNQVEDTHSAKYHIQYKGGSIDKVVDINALNLGWGSTYTNRWYSLGTYTWSANAGSIGEYVYLNDSTGDPFDGSRMLPFDDIKWIWRGESADCPVATPAVGDGTSRRQMFVDAFNRNGGVGMVGTPQNVAHWWDRGNGTHAFVLQDFTGTANTGLGALIQDESVDVPGNTLPAFWVHGGIWNYYIDANRAWLGAPTSDDYFTGASTAQSYVNGRILWNNGNPTIEAWNENQPNWKVEYWNNRELAGGRTWVGSDTNPVHDWTGNAPEEGRIGVFADNFSVRWTRTMMLPAGKYRFKLKINDGGRFYLDGNRVIDQWHTQAPTEYTYEIRFGQDATHEMRFEYFEADGNALASLTWDYTPLLAMSNDIMIEAGHGGNDSGALSCDRAYTEADVVLSIANQTAAILRQKGYSVRVVRSPEMAGFAGKAFVALHIDSCISGVTGYKISRFNGQPGTGLIGNNDAADRLTQSLWNQYGQLTGITRDTAAGHFTNNMLLYYALNPDHINGIDPRTPGAIIEMGFWSGNGNDLINRQGIIARGVAGGILAFLGDTLPVAPTLTPTPTSTSAPSTTPSFTPTPSLTPSLTATPTSTTSALCAISINNGKTFVNQRQVEVHFDIKGADEMQLSNDGGFGDTGWQPYTSPVAWALNDPGQRIATLLVYGRFRNATNPLCNGATLIDDVIYDPLSPTVIGLIVRIDTFKNLLHSTVEEVRNVVLRLFAADQEGGSGVEAMQISEYADFVGAPWQPYKSETTLQAKVGSQLYIRVRDTAGNISDTNMLVVSSPQAVYLPFVER